MTVTPGDGSIRLHVVSARSVASMVRDAVTADRDGLRAAIRSAVADLVGTAPTAPVTVADGGWPIIRPNPDGTWPKVTLINDGRTYEWIRTYGTGQLAPIPTAADGFLDGNIITPVLDGEIAGPRVLWSDSMVATQTADIGASRAGTPFDGGDIPYWVSDITGLGDSRARVQPQTGMELYSKGVAWVEEPTVPATGTVRTSWKFGALVSNNSVLHLLRGVSATDPARVMLRVKNDAGRLVFSVERAVDSTTTTVATVAAFSTATLIAVDTTSDKVVVNVDGVKVGEYVFPAGTAARASVALWTTNQWNSASLLNLKQETL